MGWIVRRSFVVCFFFSHKSQFLRHVRIVPKKSGSQGASEERRCCTPMLSPLCSTVACVRRHTYCKRSAYYRAVMQGASLGDTPRGHTWGDRGHTVPLWDSGTAMKSFENNHEFGLIGRLLHFQAKRLRIVGTGRS